jgi:hypothetical protein
MPLSLDAPVSLDSPSYDLDGDTIHIFTPNIAYDMGAINPDTTGNQRRLFGYYKPHGRFIPVWKLPDGTYTEEQPFPLIDPEFAREGNLPSGQWNAVTYVKVYQSPERVSDAEAAALSAAGYSANLS